MNRYHFQKILLSLLFLLFAFDISVLADTIVDSNSYSPTRYEGANRYKTALAIAEQYCDTTTQNIIIASGNNFPDALASGVLAHKLNAPILLVDKTAAGTKEAFEYLADHFDPEGTIYLIGGKDIIQADFSEKLKSMGYSNILQIGGNDRYHTSVLISQAISPESGTPVFITTGLDFPNALTISSFAAYNGWPLLLVDPNNLSENMRQYLIDSKPGQIYIAGTTSEVSVSVENELQGILPSSIIKRIAGGDRYSTLISIVKSFALNPASIYIASGSAFPDALTGSVLAAKTGSPIILVDPKQSNPPEPVSQYLNSLTMPNVYIFGGSTAIPSTLAENLVNEIAGTYPKTANPVSFTAAEISQKFSPSTVLIETYDSKREPLGQGSGFLVANDKIVTNYHVIEGSSYINIIFPDKQSYSSAELYGYDANRDIAIIKIPQVPLTPLKLGDSEQSLAGENIVVISNPMGLSNSVSNGNISSIDRVMNNYKWFQITASVSPGSSGGAVFNTRGEVIGIVTRGYTDKNAQNINFIIPINDVKTIISENAVSQLSNVFYKDICNLSLDKYCDYLRKNFNPLLQNADGLDADISVMPLHNDDGSQTLDIAILVNLEQNTRWEESEMDGYIPSIIDQLQEIYLLSKIQFPDYDYYAVDVYFSDFFDFYPRGFPTKYITYSSGAWHLFFVKYSVNNYSGQYDIYFNPDFYTSED